MVLPLPPRPARLSAPVMVPLFIAIEFSGGLIQGWITPLLGVVGEQYRMPGAAVSWVLTVGLLSSAISVPLMTMLADRFGPRRLLALAVALTAIGSTLIAVAPVFVVVLLGAIVQGPVAAMLPLEMSLLKRHRPTEAPKLVGLLVGALTLGFSAGSLGAGIVMDATGSLLLTQFIGAVPVIVLSFLVPFAVPVTPGDPGRSVDWWGASLFGAALVGIMYGLSNGSGAGSTDPATVIPLVAGIACFVAFVAVENRADTPLVDVKMLRRARLGMPILLGFLVAMTLFGTMSPTVLYLGTDPREVGYGAGVSTAYIGAIFALTSTFMTVGSLLAPLLLKKVGPRAAMAIACLIAASGLTLLIGGSSDPVIATALFALTSFGTGIALAVLPGVVIDRAPESASASVSGLYNTARTIGGSLAGALVAAIMTALPIPDTPAGETPVASFLAFQSIWAVFAVLLVIAAGLSFLLSRPGRTGAAPATTSDIQLGASS